VSRETIDPDDFDGPCLGRLPRPPGTPADWVDEFEARFPDPDLVEVADQIAGEPDDWAGAPADRPDQAVVVDLLFASAEPRALAAEIERSAFEFARTEKRDVFDWVPEGRGADVLDPVRTMALGYVVLVPGGVAAAVGSAEAAAKLALRLREVDPALAFIEGNWRLMNARPGELRLISP
jgi:hypothetical protein